MRLTTLLVDHLGQGPMLPSMMPTLAASDAVRCAL
ncbi:hypothetical protein Y013_13280 [Rhodococcus pyridinivorans SB3094]|uniref:Uncharacterized protein n=1 Tax=Rhodococcus pyridinivorans SB3094 TaxID=1435356 RepID=V9XP73_9NOCA|nr:hypothetical protein Y013_13280 [Rhodococcus pyridinivorans SB3094]